MLRRKIGQTPKSKSARKLRRVIFAVFFSSMMTRKLAELRWGQYVETSGKLLLLTQRRELPSSYFDALAACPLPPGWVTSVLPLQVRQQIETYAKNKLVILLTPLAKRRAHTTQAAILRDNMMLESPPLTEGLLRKLSPMLETWSSAALDELLRCGKRSAYRAGMWILPPSKDAYWHVNGLILLHGTINEVTLKAIEQGAASSTYDKPLPEWSAPAAIADARCVLATPCVVGYRAKTNVLVFEIPYRAILRAAETMVGPHRDKFKRFVTVGRTAQVTQSFVLDGAMLSTMAFFSEFNEADLHLIAQAAKPRVAFERDVVVASASLVTDAIVVCRGALHIRTVAATATASTTTVGNGHPLPAVDGHPTDAPPPPPFQCVSVLQEHSVFGPDYLAFEDRCPTQLVAACTTEYWTISATSLHAVMKNTVQRKQVVEAAARFRESMLLLTKHAAPILQGLKDVPHLSPLLDLREAADVLRDLVALAAPKVFKPGDRLVSAGEDIHSLILVHSGRMHQLSVAASGLLGGGGGVVDATANVNPTSGGGGAGASAEAAMIAKKTVVPCALGEGFLVRGKWGCSLTASRLCEAWLLQRADVWRLLRNADPVVLAAVRRAIAATAAAAAADAHASLPGGHHHHHHTRGVGGATQQAIVSKSEAASAANTNELTVHPPGLASAARAVRRASRKADAQAREEQLKEAGEAAMARQRRRLAPNISSRVPFVAYEGLQPVRPSAKEAYEAVRKLKRGGVARPEGKPSDSAPQAASPVSPKDLSQSPLRRRSSKAPMLRSEKLTAHERIEEEMEAQRLHLRRKWEASANMSVSELDGVGQSQDGGRRRNGGQGSSNASPTPSSKRRSTASHVALHAERPSVGKAERNVLKHILADHDAILMFKRAQADKAGDVLSLAMTNPFTSFEPHAPIHKLSPTGELFTQTLGSRKTHTFDAKKYRHHSATSYLSAHAFTDI